jgi:hypothetical protein
MLDKYRTKSPTITEKLSLLREPKETAKVVTEKVKGTKAFLENGSIRGRRSDLMIMRVCL